MNRFQLPESVKDRNLERIRLRLEGATIRSSRPKAFGNPGFAMMGISSFLLVLYLGIGTLLTGKSTIQLITGLSQILGQLPWLSVVVCWLSIIGLGAVLHGIFAAPSSKPD